MWEGFVLVVDDQPVAAENSIEAIRTYVPVDQILYAQSAAGARALMEKRRLSLVFLDIDMPDTSGFGLAAYMEEAHKGLPYVFLTGYADFAAESYDYAPVDFLTKPVDLKRLGRTFEKLKERSMLPAGGKVAVRSGQDYVLIAPKEIRHICKEKRKIWIYMKDSGRYQVSASMDELERIFEDYGLFRCHQSFLVPLGDIEKVTASSFGQTYEAVLLDRTVLPVSRSKYARLREELEAMGIPFIRSIHSAQEEI